MGKRGKAPETKSPPGYTRFTEAVKLFSPLSKNAFNYRVKSGDIKTKEDALGKMYETASVLSMRETLIKSKKRPATSIDWLTADDIIASLELDKKVYGEYPLGDASTYQSWKKKNPQTSLAVYDVDDRKKCYAYIGLIPLKEETIMDVLLGKRADYDLTTDDILLYDAPGIYNLLAISAVHDPEYPEFINTLLSALMVHWVDKYPQLRIKRIYAQTVTDSGRIMAKKLYLGPLYIMKNNLPERIKDAYVLDLDEPAGSKIIRRYQEKLKEKESPLLGNDVFNRS